MVAIKRSDVAISLLIIAIIKTNVNTLDLPGYIKKCSLSDPKLNDCIMENANDAIPEISKGDKRFKIIPMDPITISSIELINTGNIEMKLRDVSSDSVKNIKVERAKFDRANKKLQLNLYLSRLEVLSEYTMKGQIVIMGIRGNGKSNITVAEARSVYVVDFKSKEIDGKEVFAVNGSSFAMTVERVYYQFENLIDDRDLGRELNEFLNLNWRELYEELKPVLFKVVQSILDNVVDRYFSNVPLEGIFNP